MHTPRMLGDLIRSEARTVRAVGKREALMHIADLVDARDAQVRVETTERISGLTDAQAMDLWWEATDDVWAVPDHIPARFLRHVVAHIERTDQ